MTRQLGPLRPHLSALVFLCSCPLLSQRRIVTSAKCDLGDRRCCRCLEPGLGELLSQLADLRS
ncbi:hypothetical protein CONLIGDRAFT_494307 [Coniochaeta ligniaria NRRL 30616]|uniref:Uncharacterized protein n=1 Tax=Coniochaeta ligniaria NRRL 30616 TaxID=1408157 RepID=A0A1J7IHX8_9PEZI|nr:hypothetical protein CONLIGDRAFT_494307 [Coniochaeta ligniaria NRRL 30616]